MREEVIQWYKHWTKFQTYKISRQNHQTLSVFPNNTWRLKIIITDSNYILTMRYRSSLITTPIASKGSIAELEPIEEHFIVKFSVSKKLVTDNGKDLCSNMLKPFTEHLGIKSSTAYHPKSNDFIERADRILKSFLRVLNDLTT